jgi:hypothetical protein
MRSTLKTPIAICRVRRRKPLSTPLPSLLTKVRAQLSQRTRTQRHLRQSRQRQSRQRPHRHWRLPPSRWLHRRKLRWHDQKTRRSKARCVAAPAGWQTHILSLLLSWARLRVGESCAVWCRARSSWWRAPLSQGRPVGSGPAGGARSVARRGRPRRGMPTGPAALACAVARPRAPGQRRPGGAAAQPPTRRCPPRRARPQPRAGLGPNPEPGRHRALPTDATVTETRYLSSPEATLLFARN